MLIRALIAVVCLAAGAAMQAAWFTPECKCTELDTRVKVLTIERDAAMAVARASSKTHSQRAQAIASLQPAGATACERAQAIADVYLTQ